MLNESDVTTSGVLTLLINDGNHDRQTCIQGNGSIKDETLIFEMSNDIETYLLTLSHVYMKPLGKTNVNINTIEQQIDISNTSDTCDNNNNNNNNTSTAASTTTNNSNHTNKEPITTNTNENENINILEINSTNTISLSAETITTTTISNQSYSVNLIEIGKLLLENNTLLQYLLLNDDMQELLGYFSTNTSSMIERGGEGEIQYNKKYDHDSNFIDTSSIKWKFYSNQYQQRQKQQQKKMNDNKDNIIIPKMSTSANHIYFHLEDGEEYDDDDDDEEYDDNTNMMNANSDSNNNNGSNGNDNSNETKSEYLKLCSIDCEMCFTEVGLELTRVTVVCPFKGIVLDEFVKPTNVIIDYNTTYSGIGEEDLLDVTTTINDVYFKLSIMIDPDTIIIGHSTDSDLKALKLIHTNIIDTAALYPHKLGLPYKNSLRYLAKTILNKDIQQGREGNIGV